VGFAALWLLWAAPALAQVAILQIRVIEGEGAVHLPGSRSPRPITVEITEETGKPVAGAAVSFHLPEGGPGGAFVNGLRTATGISLDRAAIHMDEHVKELGTSSATATLFDGVVATISVEVVAK